MDCGLVVACLPGDDEDALGVLLPEPSLLASLSSGDERSGPARNAHSSAATRATATEATSASSHTRLPPPVSSESSPIAS